MTAKEPRWRTVRTPAELAKVLEDGDYAEIRGDGYYEVSGSATVSAWGSATVRAWGSATVSAWDSATVRAWDSATVSAWGSATVRASGSATVRASGSATVRAWGSATVHASGYVAVHKHSKQVKVKGGVVIVPPDLDTAEAWLDYYGIDADGKGRVVLYKGVRDDFTSEHGWSYQPGKRQKVVPDWNTADACGGGLHLSPRPVATHAYCDPVRYVACTVAVADLVPITDGQGGSDKVKVRRVLSCAECDIDGNLIVAERVAS